MAETKIQWADYTFNPWRGCEKVSAGCANCYAEKGSKRNPKILGEWGKNGTRVVAAETYWRQPLKWDREAMIVHARKIGPTYRPKVFCASFADVFESWSGVCRHSNGEQAWSSCTTLGDKWEFYGHHRQWNSGDRPVTLHVARERLYALIDRTPYLDWLLLTKRPENINKMQWPVRMVPDGPVSKMRHPGLLGVRTINQVRHNVWLGTSIESQEEIGRLRHLCYNSAHCLFVSAEPLLGPLDFRNDLDMLDNYINWMIIGGESGNKARPCNIAWIRELIRQCRSMNVAPFVKQIGDVIAGTEAECRRFVGGKTIWRDGQGQCQWKPQEPKGGNMGEWPEDIRIREQPKVAPVNYGRMEV